MKVLFMINGLHPGGKERRLLELLKYLRANSDVSSELLLMTREIRYPEVHDLGIPIHYLIRRSRKDLGIYRRLYRLLSRMRPDIIHVWDGMTAVYAAPLARLLGIKLVNGMITNAPLYLRRFGSLWFRTKLSFPFSSAIVGNSYAGLDGYKAPPAKSHCIYNGFSRKRLANLVDPEEVRRRFDLTAPHIVGMVGEFADRKDHATFLRAAHRVLAERDDVLFVMVGDGKNEPLCRAMVAEQFREKVRFLGWQKDVESIVNVMTVSVLTSNGGIQGEGISNSILEYMALGKPVVATDCGGTKEILLDGETGFLVQNRNDSQVAEKVLELLRCPERAAAMGKAGRERIERLFSIERMGERYLMLYRTLIGGVAR